MDLLLILFLAAVGMALGSAVGIALPGQPEFAIVLGPLGGFAGIIFAYVLLSLTKSREKRAERVERVPRRQPPRRRRVVRGPPSEFRSRLAAYCHRAEDEVMVERESFKSRMPFWMANLQLLKIPPKSRAWFRERLKRIHELLSRP